MVIHGWYNFGKSAYARTRTGNHDALFDNKLAICYAAQRDTEIGKCYRCPIYRVLLHRRSLNHKMNYKLVQPVCTDITRLLECMHRFRVGRPNIILRATNIRISDQMRSPRMIFGRIWRPGDRPFPALHHMLEWYLENWSTADEFAYQDMQGLWCWGLDWTQVNISIQHTLWFLWT